MTLTITSQAITLLSIDNVTQMKTATSDLDSVKAAIPVRVQEGGNYSYSASMQNSSDSDTEYKTLLFYDVLPYVDDTKATDSEAKRNSKWNGYLIPDSVQLKQVSSSGTVNLDPSMYTVWVGPIIKKNGSYVLQDVSILPKPADDLMDTEKNNFYRSLYQDVNGKNSYFVKLSELIGDHEAGRISDAEYDRLVRGIRAIWAQMNNANTRLDKKNRMELYYEMHAPLNLPKYVGTPTTEDENESAASAESIRKQVEGVTQWNTFASGYDSASAIGKNYQVFENTQAGAYISAPSGKGYIGSYVWSDLNYDAQCNEAEYEMSANGRLLPTGKWTTDIDFDGKPDDPGINGVKVELLTKKGYSVNVNGEAVIADPDPDSNPNPEKTRYVVIDEETGQPKTIVENNTNSYQYTFDGPVTYTTESDYYGNQGYFMLSNLTPGDYRLRYTLPQGYDQYSVTTRELGQTGTALKVYRDGKVVYTGIRTEDDQTAVANEIANTKASSGQLIVQTAPIHVDAVEEDLTKHQAYDTAMTSYMLGVSRGYTYGGWAWVDETDNNGTIESDGIMQEAEQKLKDVTVEMHEVDADGNIASEIAVDGDGNPAVVSTSDEGYYQFRLYPNKNYVAVAKYEGSSVIPYKPSPFVLHNDPLETSDDNDLTKAVNNFRTRPFLTGVPYDKNQKPLYENDGQTFQINRSISLGFVNGSRGFIGQWIWDDENYNGIRDTFEKGIEGVTVTLQPFYYDGDTGKWVAITGGERDIKTSESGSYVFQNVSSYYEKDGREYLAGYRLYVDPAKNADLYQKYAITKYKQYPNSRSTENSDLQYTGNMQYYLIGDDWFEYGENGNITATYHNYDKKDDIIIIAGETTNQNNNVIAYKDTHYDTGEAQRLLDYSGGFTEIQTSEVTGYLWEDNGKNAAGEYQEAFDYDGIRNTVTAEDSTTQFYEKGIAGATVQLEQTSHPS